MIIQDSLVQFYAFFSFVKVSIRDEFGGAWKHVVVVVKVNQDGTFDVYNPGHGRFCNIPREHLQVYNDEETVKEEEVSATANHDELDQSEAQEPAVDVEV